MLRANSDRKSAFLKRVGRFRPNFRVEGASPTNHFWHGYIGQWMPYNFVADSIHTKKLCSRISSSDVQFETENGGFALLSLIWRGGFEGNVRCSAKAHWKRVVDFLLVLIELFPRCYGWGNMREYRLKIISFFAGTRLFWPKISATRCRRPSFFFVSEN